MPLTTLYLVRHGQTVWNVEGRMQGRLDSGLTSTGSAQAHAHGKLLKKLGGVDRMIVSPAGRTRETANILNSYIQAPLEYDDALQERDIGEWSGMTVAEIEASYPQAWRERMKEPFHFRPPGGENLEDMAVRCEELLSEIGNGSSSSILMVTHQVMSRVIDGRLMGLAEGEVVSVLHPNELLYRFEFDDVSGSSSNTDMRSPTPAVTHYVSGDGPRPGLLHQSHSETIARLRRETGPGDGLH